MKITVEANVPDGAHIEAVFVQWTDNNGVHEDELKVVED